MNARQKIRLGAAVVILILSLIALAVSWWPQPRRLQQVPLPTIEVPALVTPTLSLYEEIWQA
ncbi:hypothetical protein [Levilinea saccharolytica]|uniref:Uncharacterized protein n=1 Tax=Levilinea saccharolytica TaxID=229921 RepID=A0A0P6Y358_9CHLR|nr:hypothetical protein [Levilinea saccharolytica]KPL83581.1 hypothetical protein ADN01_07685 [Levilinea saccharolytica]GAP18626.1 hypothetical protein LSAC_02524 [Levilinea saccharolytica]